jgi:hypothetical protein
MLRVQGAVMEFVDLIDDGPQPISIARCRELLGEEADSMTEQEAALIRRHAATMACIVVEMYQRLPDSRVEIVPRKRHLSEPANGSTLPTMVGVVIYVRVSTTEQTENLSLPTELRAYEEYCRRPGYQILERFH